jgi:predicted amidohydrolase
MGKKRLVKIALAQIKYSLVSEENVEKIKRYILLARKNGAEIVCFPEACLHQSKQFEIEHHFIREIRDECRKNKIWAIINDDLKIKSKYYNAALLINRDGKIAGVYKKINSYGDEGTEKGNKIFVLKTDFAKIGIAICWDLRFPEIFKKMKARGVEIVFCPARWCYEFKAYNAKKKQKEKRMLKSLLRARAYENLFFIGLVNPVIKGKYFRDLVSYSALASPQGIVKKIEDKEGMIYVNLNLNEIKKAERIYPS